MTKALMRASSLLGLKEFDDLFSDFFAIRPYCGSTNHPVHRWEVIDDKLVFEYSLAGYPKDNLQVDVTDHSITVKANKVEGGGSNFLSRRAFTQGYRDPEGKWDFPNSEVEYKDGLLTIKVPQIETTRSLSLTIK